MGDYIRVLAPQEIVAVKASMAAGPDDADLYYQ